MSETDHSSPAVSILHSQLLAAWKAGKKLGVEQLLKQQNVRRIGRQDYLGLILAEYQLRVDSGETPTESEFLDRFPKLRMELSRILQQIRKESIGQVSTASAGEVSQATSADSFNRTQSVRYAANLKDSVATEAQSISGIHESIQPPLYIGRYRVISEIGRGGFGVVFRAADPQMDREVAIKLLRPDRAASAGTRSRFLREARAAAGLSHPGICPIFSIEVVDESYVLVFPFVEGKTLAAAIKEKTHTFEEVVRLVMQLSLALHHAHLQGIIHRDLKPANIMIEPDGNPVIMDFGLARRHESGDTRLTMQGDFLGTPCYMSPEQARGDQETVGTTSDIYSLGVILYELLCHQRPFSGAVFELFAKIQHGRFELPRSLRPEIPAELEAICLKAMTVAPGRRFAGMQQFHDALESFLDKAELGGSAPTISGSALKSATSLAAGRLRSSRPRIADRRGTSLPGSSFKVFDRLAGSLSMHGRYRTYAALLTVVLAVAAVGFSVYTRVPEIATPEISPAASPQQSAPQPLNDLASATFLHGAWHVDPVTEDANFNGVLDEGEDRDNDGKISEIASGFSFFIDRDGNLAIAEGDRLIGGPENASGVILRATCENADSASGTALIRIEAQPAAEQDAVVTALAARLPTSWNLRLFGTHQLQGLQTSWIDVVTPQVVTVEKQVPVTVLVEGQRNTLQAQNNVRRETATEMQTVEVQEERQVPLRQEFQHVFLAHRISPDCFSEPNVMTTACVHAEAVSGQTTAIVLPLPVDSGAQTQFAPPPQVAPRIRISGNPYGRVEVADAGSTGTGGAFKLNYTSDPRMIGPDIAWFSLPVSAGTSQSGARVLSVWSEPKRFPVSDEFCVVWQSGMRRDDPFATAGSRLQNFVPSNSTGAGASIDFYLPVESSAANVRFEVLSNPKHGTLASMTEPLIESGEAPDKSEIHGAGVTLEYIPERGFLGADSLQFRWAIGTEYSRTATLSIWVTACDRPAAGYCHAPVAVAPVAPLELPAPAPAPPGPSTP